MPPRTAACGQAPENGTESSTQQRDANPAAEDQDEPQRGVSQDRPDKASNDNEKPNEKPDYGGMPARHHVKLALCPSPLFLRLGVIGRSRAYDDGNRTARRLPLASRDRRRLVKEHDDASVEAFEEPCKVGHLPASANRVPLGVCELNALERARVPAVAEVDERRGDGIDVLRRDDRARVELAEQRGGGAVRRHEREYRS